MGVSFYFFTEDVAVEYNLNFKKCVCLGEGRTDGFDVFKNGAEHVPPMSHET